jgi:hypothetical protein
MQLLRACGLLPNCELADDLPFLLPVVDLSIVNDYLLRHYYSKNATLLNGTLLNETKLTVTKLDATTMVLQGLLFVAILAGEAVMSKAKR